MKFLKSMMVVASLMLVGACATGPNVFQSIPNPITNVDIYRVKNTYAATLQLAKEWRAYCYSKAYGAIMADPVAKPVCQQRRQTVRQIQKYQPLAGAAVRRADEFVKNNPTVNAAGAIGLAWDAVTDFQKVVPTVNK